ncbi:MAG: FHA domain-containing protein [Myxococcota bacterium]
MKSGETHMVPPEGATIGRAGARADIPLNDPGVSKKHARVYEQAGTWYLRDEGSSNGTFLQGQRLTGPVVLAEGSVFGMSRHKFKVTRIEEEGTSEQPQVGASLYGGESFLSEPSSVRPKGETGISAFDAPVASSKALPSLAPLDAAYDEGEPPLGAEPPPFDAAPRTSPDAAPPAAAPVASPPQGAAAARLRAGLAGSVPFLLSFVPRLLVAPRSATAHVVHTYPQAEMDGVALIGFALPAFVGAALFQGMCSFVAGLLSGGEANVTALFPGVALIAAVLSSAVSGALFHPITGWLLEALRGSSDVRGRSNLFASMMGALLLSQCASGLAVICAATAWRPMGLVAGLLQACTLLIAVVVLHQWLQHFRVLPAARHAVMVLGGIGALAIGGVGLASSVVDSVESSALADGAPPPGTDAPATAEAPPVPDAARARDEAEGAAAPESPPPAAPPRAEDTRSVPSLPKAPNDFSYPQFRDRRDKMEDALNRDVTLLSRVRGALEAYRAFHRVKHEIDGRYNRMNVENSAEVRVNERLAEQELYLRAHSHVQAFWQAVERNRP